MPWRPNSPIVEDDLAAIATRLDLSPLEGATVLITGANGMLAHYLVDTLAWWNAHHARRPIHIKAIVRRPVPGPARPGVELLVHDARFALQIDADYFLLTATKGAPARYLAEPLETLALNSSGLAAWLDAATHCRARAVLYFSSGEIYGTPDLAPTPESYAGRIDPTLPRSVYAEAKRFGETLALAYHRQHHLPVTIARPFQIFGPGIRPEDTRAMSAFLLAAAKGESIHLESAGAARRTFLYLADATVAFFTILLHGTPGTAYNVGAESPEITIGDLAARIQARAGQGTVHIPPSAPAIGDAPARTCPDISRLRALGFAPRYSLDDIIDRSLAWLRHQEAVPC